MKKLVMFMFFVTVNMSFALSQFAFQETSDDKGGSTDNTGAYNVVYITVEEDGCALNCFGGGSTECDWGTAPCECDGFGASNSQDMFDHAHAQMDLNILTGTYVSNILPSSGVKYYRSVSWTEDGSGNRSISYILGID